MINEKGQPLVLYASLMRC